MFKRLCFACLLLVLTTCSTTRADIVSGNFSTNDNSGIDQDVLASEFAGVVSANNWNNLAGTAGSSGLVYSDGAMSGATVTWTTNNSWGGTQTGDLTGDSAMMTTWLDDASSLSVTISGISGTYNLYLYGTSGNAGNLGKELGWKVNGTDFLSVGSFTTESANGDYFNGLVDGAAAGDDPTYLLITGLTGDVTITRHSQSSTFARSSLSGFQFVTIPEPATGLMVGFVGLGIVALRRRRK